MNSNMYIIGIGDLSYIIDPCLSEEANNYIQKNGIRVSYIILTHEHYDHISGVDYWRKSQNAKVICNNYCSQAIVDDMKNYSRYFDTFVEICTGLKSKYRTSPFKTYADIIFENRLLIKSSDTEILLLTNPGHTKGSITIKLDEKYLFSGDSLFKSHLVQTKLMGGSRKAFNDITLTYFKSLSGDIKVFPGHGESFLLKDSMYLYADILKSQN